MGAGNQFCGWGEEDGAVLRFIPLIRRNQFSLCPRRDVL